MEATHNTRNLLELFRERAAQERARAAAAPNARDRAKRIEMAEIFEARALPLPR